MSASRIGAILLLAFRYLAHRRFATLMSIGAISFSLAAVTVVGAVDFAVKRSAVEGSIRYPLLVGPESASGVQLILSAIFHVDKPAGTIPYRVFEELKDDRRVTAAYPVAVADSFRGVRIVGTSPEFLSDLNVGPYNGSIGLVEVTSVVAGFDAARRTGLNVGDRFRGQHGMVGGEEAHEHGELEYVLAGILNPVGGPEDSALYTTVRSVWQIHAGAGHDHVEQGEGADPGHATPHPGGEEHGVADDRHHADKYRISDGRLTAVLVRTANPVFTVQLEREYTLRDGSLAVDTGRSIRDLVAHLNKGGALVQAAGGGMLAIAAAMILVTLLMSIDERRRELALLRSLGVRRSTLALSVMFEALLITLGGVAVGLCLGHVSIWWAAAWIKGILGVGLEPLTFTRMETWSIAAALVAGQLVAIAGSIRAYRLDLVEEIARN